MPGFKVTGANGFHITFENEWTVSVQFGPGNYCDNYDAPFQYPGEKVENLRSTTAECAVWAEDGGMVCYKDWSDTVSNRSTPAEVLELLNWAAAQPREAGVEA